ncbi:MAG: UDP-N-acetylglucosamine 4,6-dehydratase (inverting) [Acidobacteriia bacterium]|nr:UDP-N-acetylglucosamine 4,6-dehydratase (inverting) [Terriglobia bacterium]
MSYEKETGSNGINWSDLTVLVTGGTGSFGKQFVRCMLADYHPRKLVVFSRDELKQHEMQVSGFNHPSLRYFIGDVRDLGRLRRALQGIDVVVHAAALKQVPVCEYNPLEAVKTNIEGARNIIDAALDAGVKKVLALSTDKAVNPANLYGATKLVAEKLFVHANAYSGSGPTRFSCVRYGNVVASRGSVIPLFLEQRKTGVVTVTDRRMTRFWLTLDQGVQFVIKAIERMEGGEVFVPKIPSMRLMDLAETIAPGCAVHEIGIRAGEKLHEVLVSEDEGRNAVELNDMYVIHSAGTYPGAASSEARPMADGFRYASETNSRWLSSRELLRLAEILDEPAPVEAELAVR